MHAKTQRGAALLLAMIILTLVSTVAAGMVWQQSRAIQVEAAERARAQAVWLLNGGLEWGRYILRSNNSRLLGGPSELSEIKEMRLSSFLAIDQTNNADADLDAFFSGRIVDAQSRWNLRNVLDKGKVDPLELRTLQRLCESAGVPGTAELLAEGLRLAWAGAEAAAGAPLAPTRVSQLAWLGLDADTLERLAPLVEILPERTTVNVNTAAREVLVAVIEGLDLASAERIIVGRPRSGYESLRKMREKLNLPESIKTDEARVGVKSNYFDAYGQLRVDDRMMQEHSMLQRGDTEIVVVRRERRSLSTAPP